MIDPSVREIASDILFVSIALLGVSFIIISFAWKGFLEHRLAEGRTQRRLVVKTAYILMIPIGIPMAAVTVVGTYWPKMVQTSYVIVIALIAAIATLYLITTAFKSLINRLMKNTTEANTVKPNSTLLMYTQSLMLLALCIFCICFTLIGGMDTAVQLQIKPFKPEDFLITKWLLTDAILFFISGLCFSVYAFLDEKSRAWKTRDNEDQ